MSSDKREIIVEFAKEHPDIPEIQFIRDDPAGVKIKEIGELGMINYVFKVQSKDGCHSVVLKYGETTMRVDGQQEVSLERQDREYMGMKIMQSVLPDNVVTPYCFDKKFNIIAMEDLSHMELFVEKLKVGDFDLEVAEKLSRILAQLHEKTSKDTVDSETWNHWEKCLGPDEALDRAFEFKRRLFAVDDPIVQLTEKLRPTFQKCVKEIHDKDLLEALLALYHKKECFIHADCHCLAVFIKGCDVKLFDFEFSFLSHSAQNVSCLAMCYRFWLHDAAASPDADTSGIFNGAKQAFQRMVEVYLEERDSLKDQGKRQRYIQDLALFCGSAVFQTNMIGVERLLTLTEDERMHLMEVGLHLMTHHRDISTIDQLVKATFPGSTV